MSDGCILLRRRSFGPTLLGYNPGVADRGTFTQEDIHSPIEIHSMAMVLAPTDMQSIIMIFMSGHR
jgi:hypothetical protein